MTKRSLPAWAACLSWVILTGCDRGHQPRVYDAPKDSTAVPTAAAASSLPPGHPPMALTPIAWTVPAGWRELPGEGMRFATLLLDEGDPPLELTVTALGLGAGNLLENINRWRGQVGLAAIQAAELDAQMQTVMAGDRPVHWVSLAGPAVEGQPGQQILGGILLTDQRVWFFKAMGSADRVGRYEEAFGEFLKTVRVDVMPQTAKPQAAESGAMTGTVPVAPETEKMTWTLPASPGTWTEDADPGMMRVAAFTITHHDQTALIAITRFPGDVGGLLANVNRWRQQMNLAPVAALEQQPITRVDIADNPAGVVDLVAAPAHHHDDDDDDDDHDHGSDDPNRMIVVLVPRPAETWFIRFTGPNSLLEIQKEAFAEFIHSIRFVGGGDD